MSSCPPDSDAGMEEPASPIAWRHSPIQPCPDGDACPDARRYGAVHPHPKAGTTEPEVPPQPSDACRCRHMRQAHQDIATDAGAPDEDGPCITMGCPCLKFRRPGTEIRVPSSRGQSTADGIVATGPSHGNARLPYGACCCGHAEQDHQRYTPSRACVKCECREWCPQDREPPEARDAQISITIECRALERLLLEKNKAYGNSALDPIRCFSRADAVEQIKVRIDDKLSRLMRGSDAGEDVVLDLLGYLILLRIAQKTAQAAPKPPTQPDQEKPT